MNITIIFLVIIIFNNIGCFIYLAKKSQQVPKQFKLYKSKEKQTTGSNRVHTSKKNNNKPGKICKDAINKKIITKQKQNKNLNLKTKSYYEILQNNMNIFKTNILYKYFSITKK